MLRVYVYTPKLDKLFDANVTNTAHRDHEDVPNIIICMYRNMRIMHLQTLANVRPGHKMNKNVYGSIVICGRAIFDRLQYRIICSPATITCDDSVCDEFNHL